MKRVVLLGFIGLMLAAVSGNSIVDLDLFHEFSLIRETLAEGSIPKVDVFSYVPTIRPVVHHEWGTGALLYFITVQSGLGATGLVLTKLALVTAISIGCYLYAKRSGVSIAVIGPLAIIATIPGAVGITNIRAQFFTLLFLVILLLLLQQDRSGKRWWIGLWLPLYVIWVNLHGGFILGIGLVVLYGLERLLIDIIGGMPILAAFRRVRHLGIVTIAMFALILVNPYGIDYLWYLWHAMTLDRSQWVSEWFRIWRLRDPGSLGRIAIFILSAVVTIYAVIRSKKYRAPGILFLLVAAWQSIMHFRHLSIYAVAWICITPAYVEDTGLGQAMKATWEHKRRILAVIWAIILVFGCGIAIRQKFWHLQMPTLPDKKCPVVYPVGAVDYLKSQALRVNVMVTFDTGAYVSWKLYPDVKVSVDSRFEVAYPVDWVLEVAMLYAGTEGWQDTLMRYPTDAVLVPRHSPLEKLLEQSVISTQKEIVLEWRKVYIDDGFSLFVRSEIADGLPVIDNRGKPITASFP